MNTKSAIALAISVAVLGTSTTARAAIEPRVPRRLHLTDQKLAMNAAAGQVLPPGFLLAATPAGGTPGPEVGRLVGGYFAGAGLQIVGLVLAAIPLIVSVDSITTLGDLEAPVIAWLALTLLGAPALSAAGVWGIADSSPDYEASYLLTWLGGVAGSGVALGLLYALAANNSTSPDASGWLLMWFIPPLGEVMATGLTRTPQQATTGPISSPVAPGQPVEVLARGEPPRSERTKTVTLLTLALP